VTSLGTHHALDDDTLAVILAATDDDEVLELIEQVDNEADGPEDVCRTEEAWDPIHRSLTDGRLQRANGTFPLSAAVLGGRHLLDSETDVAVLVTSAQVRDVAAALRAVTKDALKSGYDTIDPADYTRRLTDDDFDSTWDTFTELVTFFGAAARNGHHTVFTATL
jgi:hypothetical protein